MSLCLCSGLVYSTTPSGGLLLCLLQFTVSYIDLLVLFFFFLTLSLSMGISKDSQNISNPERSYCSCSDIQLLALLASVKESILLKSSLAWNCNLLPMLKFLWVLPLRKWCVRLLGKCSRQGYMVLTVLSRLEYIKITIEYELPPPLLSYNQKSKVIIIAH